MTLIEILELNKKKRIFFKRPKHTNWLWNDSLRVFIMLNGDLSSPDSNYETYNFYLDDLIATDWVLKREQPKVAQYFYVAEKGNHSITTECFLDDNQFKMYYPQAKDFKRLQEMDTL